MIQHYARSAEGEHGRDDSETEDHWNTASVLLESLKTEELLDRNLSLQNLLILLHHQHQHISPGITIGTQARQRGGEALGSGENHPIVSVTILGRTDQHFRPDSGTCHPNM